MFSKLKDNYDTERQEIVAEYVVTNVRPGDSHMLYQLSLPLEVYQGAVTLDGLAVRVNEWLQDYGKLEHRAHKIKDETLYLNNLPGVAVVRFNPGFTTSKFVQFPGVQGFALASSALELKKMARKNGLYYYDGSPTRRTVSAIFPSKELRTRHVFGQTLYDWWFNLLYSDLFLELPTQMNGEKVVSFTLSSPNFGPDQSILVTDDISKILKDVF